MGQPSSKLGDSLSLKTPKNPSWDELHCDLLCLIAGKLDLSHRIRLSLVCKSWRSWRYLYTSTTHDMPRLVLLHHLNRPYLRCLSLSTGGVENLRLPETFKPRFYIGSSNGWLIFEDSDLSQSSENVFSLYLFNPISSDIIPLPPLPTSSKPISNITVSSSRESKTMMVAALACSSSRLMLCRPMSITWTIFSKKSRGQRDGEANGCALYPRIFTNILFQGDTLFVLSEICHRPSAPGNVHYASRFKSYRSKRTFFMFKKHRLNIVYISILDPLLTKYSDRVYYGSSHLAASTRGGVMVVIRWYTLKRDQQNPWITYSSTEDIILYKWDDNSMLVAVNDIGDQILFLGRFDSQMLCSKRFDEPRRNCVMFTEGCYVRNPKKEYIHRQSGVFNLESRKSECSVYTYTEHYPYYLDWFLPSYSFDDAAA